MPILSTPAVVPAGSAAMLMSHFLLFLFFFLFFLLDLPPPPLPSGLVRPAAVGEVTRPPAVLLLAVLCETLRAYIAVAGRHSEFSAAGKVLSPVPSLDSSIGRHTWHILQASCHTHSLSISPAAPVARSAVMGWVADGGLQAAACPSQMWVLPADCWSPTNAAA